MGLQRQVFEGRARVTAAPIRSRLTHAFDLLELLRQGEIAAVATLRWLDGFQPTANGANVCKLKAKLAPLSLLMKHAAC